MNAAAAEVHRMQAMTGRGFSDDATSVVLTFIQVANAAERAALAALTGRDGGDSIAAAADMRKGTLGDSSPTLTAGGGGVSLNSAPSVAIAQGLRRVRADGSVIADDERAESPLDVSMDDLTQEDVDFIAIAWRWTRMSAQLAGDILDGRGDHRADAVETLGKAVLAAREELLERPRGLAREVIEAALLSNAVTYRLVTERRAVQEAPFPADGTVYALDRRNQSVSKDVAYTVTSQGEGARQPIVMLNTGKGVKVQVTKKEVEEFTKLASAKPAKDRTTDIRDDRGEK